MERLSLASSRVSNKSHRCRSPWYTRGGDGESNAQAGGWMRALWGAGEGLHLLGDGFLIGSVASAFIPTLWDWTIINTPNPVQTVFPMGKLAENSP